ncbi:MAG: 4Fe-4S binding protein [Acidobacteriaceae bacterium]|nr:4Fe-4S binding protein [Acidobacteriaceae bacterium]
MFFRFFTKLRAAALRLATLRLLSQVFFLALFVFLLLRTEFRGTVGSGGDVRMQWPVGLFFKIDPLVALSNALATHALYRGLLASLLILLPVMFLGRFFCGWICPMGTIHHFFGNLKSEAKRGKQGIDANRYKPWQRTKYVILLAVLVAALFGTGLVGWFDPFSLLVRSVGLSILPGANYAANALINAMEHSNLGAVQSAGTSLHAALAATVLSFKQPHFRQGILLGLIFLVLLATNLRVTRFWCRALCPLGALLGVASRWSILGLHKDAATCNKCNRCLMHCQGGDDPIGGAPWHKAECLMCMNCVDSCPHHSLQFKVFRAEPEIVGTNLPRRKMLTGLALGAAAVPLLRANTALGKSRDEHMIRPPGALDETDFLSRCIRCGECMKVCPTNALQPAFTEAGLEGIWSPVLTPRIGYCEPSCVLCSEVCPTGAIWKLTPRKKGWVVGIGEANASASDGNANEAEAKSVRLGTAFYDRGRCLPWAMATDCIVCEEWCPVSPKAIYLQEVQVVDADGNLKLLKQPHVDPSRCVGCGACEYACPLQEHPAVYVTSIGESRSVESQILLSRRKAKAQS